MLVAGLQPLHVGSALEVRLLPCAHEKSAFLVKLVAMLWQIPLGNAAVCGRHGPGSSHSELALLNVPLFFQLFAIETTWLIVSSSCFLSQMSAKVLAITC